MPLTTPQRKLKIAQVIDVYEFATNGAGISTQRFTELLRKHGHTVVVMSTGKPGNDKVVMKEYYPPISFFKKIMQRMKFVFAKPDKQAMREIIPQIDIVHNQFPFYLGFVSIQLARKFHKPVVSSFHVQAEQLMHNAGLMHPFFTWFAYKVMIRFIYNRSDIVICPSQFAADEIKRYGLKKPTVVISNGFPEIFKKMEVPKKYPDQFTILTVGRNAAEKRQDMLIRAIAASKYKDQIKLIILGDGPRRNDLIDLSNDLLNGNVEFNLLPPNQLIEYYNGVDLYVHAAAVEVECMTALEAMACGLPLLIADSELSATKQFALNDHHLFKTKEELTKKIDYWFTHREELQRAKQTYIDYSKQYAIENSYQQLMETYYSLLEKNANTITQPVPELENA